MNGIAWLLARVSDLLLWIWSGLSGAAVSAARRLDAWLNPLLAPLVEWLNRPLTWLADLAYSVLGWLPAWASLTLWSVVLGVLLLLAFKHLSPQRAIARQRRRVSAGLLAASLYKHDLRVQLAAQARALGALGVQQLYVIPPMLILLLLMALLLAQIGLRHQWRPLAPGERVLLVASVADEAIPLRLDAPPGVALEVDGVPGAGTVVWRLRALADGRHTLRLIANGQALEKELVIGPPHARVSAMRPGGHWLDRLLHPAEPPLPPAAGVTGIEVRYPGIEGWLSGSNSWVIFFFVASMLAALVCMPLMNVRV